MNLESSPAADTAPRGASPLRHSRWRDVARTVKRAVLGSTSLRIAGQEFDLAYEARGRCDQDDYQHIADMARDRGCVLDIGANIGLTTLLMSRAVAEGGSVYAFEASESACMILRENLLRNPSPTGARVEIVNTMVTDAPGKDCDFSWDDAAGNASAYITTRSSSTIRIKKCGTTIDGFVERNAIEPGFAKIDVEGAECDVLRGMTHTLERFAPQLFIEVHGWPGRALADQAEEVCGLLESHGYRVEELLSKKPLRETISDNGARYQRAWAVARRD
ncbi:Methyltransferase domain protein [Pseudobythopirellula maris]|uniref:Methyltransferase domain protein n=1 Tax=Pseudobythopirellula maris TaxID=2527991 RepID=A0A5C5ZSJ5_9BACT|nr:FkbM family methyltransferase [Pseudobythopirellula maris]TWT89741.1 Methyltransferase domain protein [Pseudobythopirellula maris]